MALSEHAAHEWRQEGRCVYCVPCRVRLYQGRIPKDQRAFAEQQDAAMDATVKRAEREEEKEWAARTKEQELAYTTGFLAFREDVDPITRLGLNPHTPRKIDERGLTGRDRQAEIDKRLARWWSWGWNDAEFSGKSRLD